MKSAFLAVVALMAVPALASAEVAAAKVERTADRLAVTWTAKGPVDVYVSDDPAAPLAKARLLSKADRDGAYTAAAGTGRHYYYLVDEIDHKLTKTAERVLPLVGGSNFRDIGGYAGAGGKHVRWGMIYRSGGQPMLTAEDQAQIAGLRLGQLVDLRSSEERAIAPTRINGVPYSAVGYSMMDMMRANGSGGQMRNGVEVYRAMPAALAPQLRLIFGDLLHRRTPLAYNCTAGQDRTGFTTAMILTALGVSRDQIVADYHLSTVYRRPLNELPKLDPNSAEPVTRLFASYQQLPQWSSPTPLKDDKGTPFLRGAFDEIDAKWGSVENYLAKEVGVSAADLASLRRMYLE